MTQKELETAFSAFMPGCAFIHRRMRNMLETRLHDKGRALRSLGEDGDPYKEIALAICALSKAFPGNTRALALPGPLLPDHAKEAIQEYAAHHI